MPTPFSFYKKQKINPQFLIESSQYHHKSNYYNLYPSISLLQNQSFMTEQSNQQSNNQETLYFGNTFNLHPLDSLTFLQTTHAHLEEFTYGFKQRIQCEIDYSKSLIKVSKILAKHIDSTKPSPISYVSSSFKVEHQLRARHALELADYLHSQIQIPCQQLLQQIGQAIKQMERDIRRYYKQGQVVQQNYQKQLKKYFRSRQDWQQRMICKTVLPYIPGVSSNQIQKANLKLKQEKQENIELQNKYINSLDQFNKFATKYNQNITHIVAQIEREATAQLSLETNSIRKLIVSEVNMFKNIEYDLLNISRQMESLRPLQQIKLYLQEFGQVYTNPIISIYSEGPIAQNNQPYIDFKYPLSRSLLQQTLLRIDHRHFTWMLDNKHNSTLKYAIQQAWIRFQGGQSQDFMPDLQDCIQKNKVVKEMPMDNKDKKTHYLNNQQAFSISFSIITTLASFIRPVPLTANKEMETVGLLKSYLALHHFYRFFAAISLQQLLQKRQNKIINETEQQRILMILRLIIQECIISKDIFVIRQIIVIMFSNVSGINDTPLFMKSELIQNDIWHNNDFWESVFFQGTFEEITLLPTVVKTQLKQIYLMRQKNITFSTLATYCHYMVMVGCQISQVRAIAARFCHIYGLYEEHERDLSKMIKSSAQKYEKSWYEQQQKQKRQNPTPSQPTNQRNESQSLEKQQQKIKWNEQLCPNQKINEQTNSYNSKQNQQQNQQPNETKLQQIQNKQNPIKIEQLQPNQPKQSQTQKTLSEPIKNEQSPQIK